MKTNLAPAVIIAASILAAGVLLHRASRPSVESFFSEFEEAVLTEDGNGKTAVGRVVEGLSATVSESFSEGFESGQNKRDLEVLPVFERIVVTETKIVRGRFGWQERLIGVIRNDSDEALADLTLSVIFRDKQGGLLDVNTRVSVGDGVLKPGAERAFEVERDLGDSDTEAPVLDGARAASAKVSVIDVRIVK